MRASGKESELMLRTDEAMEQILEVEKSRYRERKTSLKNTTSTGS